MLKIATMAATSLGQHLAYNCLNSFKSYIALKLSIYGKNCEKNATYFAL